MMQSDRMQHLEQLVNAAGGTVNEAFSTWNARPKSGALAAQTVALDRFAAQCAGIAQLLEMLGQRASEVASEMLEDEED